MLVSAIWYPKDSDQQKDGSTIFSAKYYIWWVVCLTLVVLAVIMSQKCNSDETMGTRFLYGLLAFLFPEIYLIQWALRKYAFKEADYCKF